MQGAVGAGQGFSRLGLRVDDGNVRRHLLGNAVFVLAGRIERAMECGHRFLGGVDGLAHVGFKRLAHFARCLDVFADIFDQRFMLID